MKTIYLFCISVFIGFTIRAQGTSTNTEGSKYNFEKIYHLESTPVLNQGFSGTCWSFSGMSFFESELIRMGHENVTLSEMFCVRKAYELKTEKFLRLNGKINFSEGGSFQDIPYVIEKFGVVPSEVYTGYVVKEDGHDHAEMFALLEGAVVSLLEYTSNEVSGVKTTDTWKSAIAGILDAYLGQDIEKFTYKNKEYTPQSFAKSLGLNMNNYVSLTSFSMYDWYSECILEIPDNWSWGKSYNVPSNELLNEVENALKNGYTVGWDADVSENGFNFKKGIAVNPERPSDLISLKENQTSNAFLEPVTEVQVSDDDRQKSFDDKTTTDDHLMHIVGLYKDQNGTNYFLVKNSWGTNNLPEGFIYISESYFRAKTINIFLNKEGLSKQITKKLNL